MAWLRKCISRNTYMTIVGIFNAVTSYLSVAANMNPADLGLVLTIGNLLLVWLGVESGNKQVKEESESTSQSEQLQ